MINLRTIIARIQRVISRLGITPETPGFERARIRFVNQFLFASVALYLSATACYIAAGAYSMAIVLAVASAITLFELGLCWLGFGTLTRHVLVAAHPVFFLGAVMLTGELISFAALYLPILSIIIFLFRSKTYRVGYVSAYLLTLVPAFFLRIENPIFPIEQISLVRMGGFFSAFLLQTIMLALYSKEISSYINRQKQSKDFLRGAQRLASIGSWEYDIRTDKVWISQQLAEMFGLSERFYPSSVIQECCSPLEPIFMLDFNENISANYQYNYSERNGDSIKWYEIRSKLIRSADGKMVQSIGTIQEVSERLNSQKEMTDNVSVMEATLESTTDGILVVSNAQEIIRFNNQFTKIWDFPKELMEIGEGRKFFRFAIKHVVNKNEFLGQVEKTYLKGGSMFFSDIILKNGRILEIYSMPLVENDEITGRVWSFRDATERKKNEQKIQELLESLKEQNLLLEKKVKERTVELELANADLTRSNTDLEQFAAAASHDLQEPLRTVANFVQLLEMQFKDDLGSSGLTYIRYASDGVERMRHLITDLLRYSKLGRDEARLDVADVNEILESKLMDLSRRIEESNATVMMRYMPDSVLCESSQIAMVFYNLIGNAIKFNDSETPEVEVGWSETVDHWEFYVKDNGIGIAPEDADKIFEIFKRLHNSQEYEGTGIGLAMCKKIVERHGGNINLSSVAGKGTTFSFSVSKNLVNHERIGQKTNGNLVG